jgi:Family of unknown function (DUF6010)
MNAVLLALEVPVDRMTAPLAIATVFGALLFIGALSLVREPSRRYLSVVALASGSSLYYAGGLGGWDKLFWLTVMGFAFAGCRWYPAIGIGWIVHTAWDIFNFRAGHALETGVLRINLHCAIFDPIIALWFAFGAPSVWELLKRRRSTLTASPA